MAKFLLLPLYDIFRNEICMILIVRNFHFHIEARLSLNERARVRLQSIGTSDDDVERNHKVTFLLRQRINF